jgi:predicted metalloprotease
MIPSRLSVIATAVTLTLTGFAGGSAYGSSDTNSQSPKSQETVQPSPEPESPALSSPNSGAALSLSRGVATAAPPPTAATAPAPYTSEEFYQDYYGALQVVNQYWTAHWADFFPGSYVPPKLISVPDRAAGLYDGTVDVVICGGALLGPDNAAYCADGDDWVAYDVNFLGRARYNGDMFVYMIVAHEWGHAIQYRLSAASQSIAAELQADCFAGAALDGGVNDGTLQLEEGDLQEIETGLTDIADSSPWGMPGDHGSPEERIQNFRIGWDGGPLACLPA